MCLEIESRCVAENLRKALNFGRRLGDCDGDWVGQVSKRTSRCREGFAAGQKGRFDGWLSRGSRPRSLAWAGKIGLIRRTLSLAAALYFVDEFRRSLTQNPDRSTARVAKVNVWWRVRWGSRSVKNDCWTTVKVGVRMKPEGEVEVGLRYGGGGEGRTASRWEDDGE